MKKKTPVNRSWLNKSVAGSLPVVCRTYYNKAMKQIQSIQRRQNTEEKQTFFLSIHKETEKILMVKFFLMGKFSRKLAEIEVMEEIVVQTEGTLPKSEANCIYSRLPN